MDAMQLYHPQLYKKLNLFNENITSLKVYREPNENMFNDEGIHDRME
jgi:hypothetical protein